MKSVLLFLIFLFEIAFPFALVYLDINLGVDVPMYASVSYVSKIADTRESNVVLSTFWGVSVVSVPTAAAPAVEDRVKVVTRYGRWSGHLWSIRFAENF